MTEDGDDARPEIRPSELRAAQPAADEPRTGQAAPTPRVPDIVDGEFRPGQVAILEESAGQVGVGEVGPLEGAYEELRAGQVGEHEVRPAQQAAEKRGAGRLAPPKNTFPRMPAKEASETSDHLASAPSRATAWKYVPGRRDWVSVTCRKIVPREK